MTNTELRDLATQALAALLERKPVVLRHDRFWTRPPGWPLPIDRTHDKRDSNGVVTLPYRPLSILEYVQYRLDLEAKSAQMRERFERTGEHSEDDEL